MIVIHLRIDSTRRSEWVALSAIQGGLLYFSVLFPRSIEKSRAVSGWWKTDILSKQTHTVANMVKWRVMPVIKTGSSKGTSPSYCPFLLVFCQIVYEFVN